MRIKKKRKCNPNIPRGHNFATCDDYNIVDDATMMAALTNIEPTLLLTVMIVIIIISIF